MNETWQAFLTEQGAAFTETVPSWPTSEHSAELYDLSDYSTIEATGDDSATFFQGQLTNNFSLITPELGQLTTSCSPKGRMLASMRIFMRDEKYYIILPTVLAETMIKRFRMYIMMSKVTLTDVSDELILTGIRGEAAITAANSHVNIPQTDYASITENDITALRVEQDRALFLAPIEPTQALWTSIQAVAQPCNSLQWRTAEIEAGIPTITTDTVDSFVPQMANIQLINGVSFDKGCYTGQEVVARVHFLGKLKKRMYRANIDTDTPPAPGAKLYIADKEQSIGEIVDIQPIGDNLHTLLAVIQIANAEQTIHCESPTGTALTMQTLPYAFPDNSE